MFCFLLLSLIINSRAQQKNPAQAKFPDIFSNLPIPDAAKLSVLRENERPLSKIRANLFVKVSSSKTTCFVGEPILVTYELYSALQNESEIDRLPSFAGFAVLELSVVNEQVVYKTIHGRSYRAFHLRQFQLVPQQSGRLTIDSLTVNNVIHYRIPPDSDRHYSGIVASTPLTIDVRALPSEKKPPDFSGVVGHFQLSVSVDSQRIAAGETNTLHIAISGSGNFIALSQPDISWPPGFDYFPVHEKTILTKNSFPPSGQQLFDIPFVPSREGEFSIPALQITYFDATKGDYKQSSSSPILIKVSPPKIKQPSKALEAKPNNQFSATWIRIALVVILILLLLIFVRKRKTK
ncbi:MAG: BatD family protein [Puia sp.]